MALKDILQQDRRLVLLRVLAESASYEANDSILDTALQAYGHNVSRDVVHAELAWLEEQDLISVRHVAHTQVATLSARGFDVAQGKARCPGVKAPRPGA